MYFHKKQAREAVSGERYGFFIVLEKTRTSRFCMICYKQWKEFHKSMEEKDNYCSLFRFVVEIPDLSPATFQEISGLDTEAQTIEYRDKNGSDFSTIKMPGIRKYSNVTLKKGIFKADNNFWNWFNKIKMNTIEPQTITIKLLNEAATPTIIWTLKNALPLKLNGTDLKSKGDEVGVDTLEIVHEGLTIEEV
jgi:phage tail-like protein